MAKKILVVDDDPSISAYIAEVLENNGYETCRASNGKEALEQLEAGTVDLITLDIEMPDVSGPKFNHIVGREGRWGNVPIIVITGHEGLRYVIPKAVATLGKPFAHDDLVHEVRQAIGA